METSKPTPKKATKKVATNTNQKEYPVSLGRKEAIEQAMADLQTFEGNLQVQETESHFLISKIR